MANPAKLTVRVTASRGASNVNISSAGMYYRLQVGGVALRSPNEPVQPTASVKAFWTSVLAIVQEQINTLP